MCSVTLQHKIDLWMGVTGSLSFIEGKEKQFLLSVRKDNHGVKQ